MSPLFPVLPEPGESFRQGVDTGSNMFARLMQPVIQREELAQRARQFQEELALRKAAAGRAAQDAADAHKRMDPMYEINQFKAIQNMLSGGNGGTSSNMEPMATPTELTGQGLGVFNPEGLQESQEQVRPINTQNSNGIDLNLLRQNPLLRAFFKKKFGIDPLSQERGISLTGAARDVESMHLLKEKYGENSPEYQQAQSLMRAKEQQHEDLSAIRQRQLHGLKPGDTEIRDPNTGETLGFRKQLTTKEHEMAKNTVLFNHLYPLVFNGASILSGTGAASKLENAARNYKNDPAARKLIDDFLIAEKALTTTAVTEAARFGAGRTNQTFNRYVETLKAENIIPRLKKWIKEYEIPPAANLKAGMRWQKELNKAEHMANNRIPATRDYYFDPEKQFAYENQKNSNQVEEDMSNLSDEELARIAAGGQ